VLLPFFSLMTFLIAVPTGVKFFNWIGTIWRGQLTFKAPMLFIIGFMTTFLLGGLTGVILASPPLDFAVTDTYFVVAHFHYVLFGTVVFCMFEYFCPHLLDDVLAQVPACDDDGLPQSKAFRAAGPFIPRFVELLFDAQDKFVDLLRVQA